MILPNVRGSFGRAEAGFLLWLLTRGQEEARAREEERLREQGLDVILDDPRTFNTLMAGREFSSAPPQLVFYLLVRHALLEDGIQDRSVADYLSTLLHTFGHADRAYRIDDETAPMRYLADIATEAERASGRRAFLLRAHLGEFALWISGLFPDHITARVQRRGAPGLDYYETMGASGFRMASRFVDAEQHGLDSVYSQCADSFAALRVALNRVADRHLFPARGARIERLLRQISDQFQARTPPPQA